MKRTLLTVACFFTVFRTALSDAAQPVHDELEYIKMRYKSPARSSFRDNNKMYATLTTQSTAYSTMSRGGVDGPNYSDDSADRILHHHREQHPGQGASSPHHQYRGSQPHIGQAGVLQVPYQGNTPVSPQQQTEIPPGMTELPPEGQTELPGTPVIMPGRQGGGYPPPPLPPQYQQPQQQQQQPGHNREEGRQVSAPTGGGQSQYRYNITGQTQGVTVI